MPRRWFMPLILVAALAGAAAPAHAMRLAGWKGHLALGYAKVFSDTLAPGGSFSVAGGVDYPVGPRWRIGPVLGFHLLGSTIVERGSFAANLDYSALEGALMLTWLPPAGPIARVSAGPGIASARAELSTAGGGASFLDLAVGEIQPSFALEVTAMPRGERVVAPGLELGLRVVPLDRQTWTLFTARLAIHY